MRLILATIAAVMILCVSISGTDLTIVLLGGIALTLIRRTWPRKDPAMALAPRTGSRAWNLLCAEWQARIDQAGGWTCRRCRRRIPPHDRAAWQLGHPHDVTTGPTLIVDLAPEHARCNTRAGARAGNQQRHTTPLQNWSL